MVKAKLFDAKNIVTSLKGIGVSIVTSLFVILPLWGVRYFQNQLNMPVVSVLLGLVSMAIYLMSWGFFAKKFWGWK